MIHVNVSLLDVEPINQIMGIVEEMVCDDRVPAEYRFAILRLMMSSGGAADADAQSNS